MTSEHFNCSKKLTIYEIKGLFFFGLISYFFSCHINHSKLSFNPVLNQDYFYSVTKISSKEWFYLRTNTAYDTAYINFTIQKINNTMDSLQVCKLTFGDYKLRRPPDKITFIGGTLSMSELSKNPFVILDSLGYYIHGLSVEVFLNNKGIVKHINGVDSVISTIAKLSNSTEKNARGLLSDYVSLNAITDLLNTIFSISPDAKINVNSKWRSGYTLITKAPVSVDNFFTLNQRIGDSAFIDFNSLRLARREEGDTPYMKGKIHGSTIVSNSTGLPFDYESKSETETNTNYYIIKEKEELRVERLTNLK